MGKLKTENMEARVKDECPIKEAARELGTPFGCEHGQCGTCRIKILEGYDNLEPLNEQELNMGLQDSPFRLACQCRLKCGEVKREI